MKEKKLTVKEKKALAEAVAAQEAAEAAGDEEVLSLAERMERMMKEKEPHPSFHHSQFYQQPEHHYY